MKNSKLIDILFKCNPSEIEKLKDFIASPYFVKQKSLIRFASILLIEYPQFQDDKVNEKKIYEGLFPNQAFNQETINSLKSQLVVLIHKFLALENFQNEDIEDKIRLLGELRKKDLRKEFARVSSKLETSLWSGTMDSQFYYHLMKFENELDSFMVSNMSNRNFFLNMHNKAEALDNYYLSTKLKLACEIINRQNVYNSEYKIELFDEVLNYIGKNIEKFENAPAVLIYYRIISTLLNPEEEIHFQELKKALHTKVNNFSRLELLEMFSYAQNYCIKKLNSGHVEYDPELFGLYHELLNTGIIFENDFISQWEYKNIVSIGLRLHEFEWVENFIYNTKSRIHPDFREVAFQFNLANLYFEKKKYKTALKTLNSFNAELKELSRIDFDDTFYNLDSRSMLLKIYYELGEEEPFRAIIESFNLFLIRNKKLSDRQRTIYLNRNKYAKRLNDERLKFRLNPFRESRSFYALKNKIEAEKNLVNKPWIQKQLEDLESEINQKHPGKKPYK